MYVGGAKLTQRHSFPQIDQFHKIKFYDQNSKIFKVLHRDKI